MTYEHTDTFHNESTRRSLLIRSSEFVVSAAIAAVSGPASAQQTTTGQSNSADSTLRFFPGFKPFRISTSGAIVNGVIGGSGPPLLLMHGWPQSHIEWHLMAPVLARSFTVVATDLRGYGDSSKPADGVNHEGYSKRAMAHDQVEVMNQLGFNQFAVVGHDRGGRVGHRMALDYPEAISKLVLLDIVPTYKIYSTVNKEFSSAYFHWFLCTQPAPLPETLLGNSAEQFLRTWAFRGLMPNVVTDDAFSEYLRHFKDPATMHAMCEDYRAAATIDLEHDRADLEKRVTCPLLVLWGERGAMHRLYDVLATWRERASSVKGKSLPGGHWLAEQLPTEVNSELQPFLS